MRNMGPLITQKILGNRTLTKLAEHKMLFFILARYKYPYSERISRV